MMDDKLFAELEASLKEGMAIVRGEAEPSRTFQFDALFSPCYNVLMHLPLSDTDPKVSAMQIEIIRKMSLARKMELVGQMNQAVKTLALAGLKKRFPEDPPEKLRRRLSDLILGPELAQKVYGPLESEK